MFLMFQQIGLPFWYLSSGLVLKDLTAITHWRRGNQSSLWKVPNLLCPPFYICRLTVCGYLYLLSAHTGTRSNPTTARSVNARVLLKVDESPFYDQLTKWIPQTYSIFDYNIKTSYRYILYIHRSIQKIVYNNTYSSYIDTIIVYI